MEEEFWDLGVSELKRLKMLEDEYARLEHSVADPTLNKHIMSFDVSVKPGEVHKGVIGFGFVHIYVQLTI